MCIAHSSSFDFSVQELVYFLQKELTGDEPASELLPKDWNKSASYGLRYVNNKELFILRGVTADDDIVFNLMVRRNVFLLL